jgi:hypothetical protein
MARPNGVVIDGPTVNSNRSNQWFTDGYGDYIRHFMTSFGSVPEWAPQGQNHLVRSSSIVKSISYLSSSITYTTADGDSTEVLCVNFTPTSVTVDEQEISQRSDLDQTGWTFDASLNVVRIRHDIGTNVQISQTTSLNAPTVMGLTPTNDTTPTWTWVSGGGGNGTYRYKLDDSNLASGGATTTTNTSYTPISALSNGTYTLYVQERDAAGNWSTSGSFTITIDTLAPVVGTFTVITSSTSRNIPITLFTASDSVGVSGYLVTTSNTPPTAGAAGWTGTAPTT